MDNKITAKVTYGYISLRSYLSAIDGEIVGHYGAVTFNKDGLAVSRIDAQNGLKASYK